MLFNRALKQINNRLFIEKVRIRRVIALHKKLGNRSDAGSLWGLPARNKTNAFVGEYIEIYEKEIGEDSNVKQIAKVPSGLEEKR